MIAVMSLVRDKTRGYAVNKKTAAGFDSLNEIKVLYRTVARRYCILYANPRKSQAGSPIMWDKAIKDPPMKTGFISSDLSPLSAHQSYVMINLLRVRWRVIVAVPKLVTGLGSSRTHDTT